MSDTQSDQATAHPEPPEMDVELSNEELEQVAYVMWSHGVDGATRARVTAELRGEGPPEWAVDPEARNAR